MNPAFVILVLMGAGALWFLLSFVFYPLGRLIYRIWKDAIDEINKNDESEERKKRKGK